MTRKALPLLMLVAAVLVSTTFTGCARPSKDEQLTAAKLEIANLKGQLRNQDRLMEDIEDLEMEAADARQQARDTQLELASAQRAPAASSGQNVVLNVSGSVAFASGSDVLTSAGKKQLDGIVGSLRGQYGGHNISIEGHTDNTPLVRTKDKWHTNLWLSANRARSVADYLMTRGVPESSISIVGHGAGAGKGRLVEIVILQ